MYPFPIFFAWHRYVVSAFIGKSGYKKEAQQLINANGPDATAKTGSAETSNYSIRNHDSVVNKELSDRDPTAAEVILKDFLDKSAPWGYNCLVTFGETGL